MNASKEQLYAERLNRYVTTMRNGKADRVPIRPFVAEFTAKYAGFSCQDVVHDYDMAFRAARKCASDFDWDAVVGNMVYVWTGLTQAIGLKYYGVPGIDVPHTTGFQYREPAEHESFMKADEYDQLIEDPTGFLFNVWLPRVSHDVAPIGAPSTFRNNLSFLKGGMAMWNYFCQFPAQGEALKNECGMPGAIAGILKAPLDIIGDKLRGYMGLTMDLIEQPDKVLAACHALAPHLLNCALATSDANNILPITIWMHRGCTPFVTMDQFHTFYWPTLKPIIEAIWANGHQTLFYAEGNWDAHLDSFAELPEGSIIYHVDQGNIFEAHRKLGKKFCLSGGIPNTLLSYGTVDEVKAYCKKVIDGVAGDGGYIMDASAIIQNDAKIENVKAMTDFTREYGVYGGSPSTEAPAPTPKRTPPDYPWAKTLRAPGVCFPWEDKQRELPQITGDHELVKKIWENVDMLGYTYIWHCLLSF